jgi:hypothetical protein
MAKLQKLGLYTGGVNMRRLYVITWFSSSAASQDGVQVHLLLHHFASEFLVSVSSAADGPVHASVAASL